MYFHYRRRRAYETLPMINSPHHALPFWRPHEVLFNIPSGDLRRFFLCEGGVSLDPQSLTSQKKRRRLSKAVVLDCSVTSSMAGFSSSRRENKHDFLEAARHQRTLALPGPPASCESEVEVWQRSIFTGTLEIGRLPNVSASGKRYQGKVGKSGSGVAFFDLSSDAWKGNIVPLKFYLPPQNGSGGADPFLGCKWKNENYHIAGQTEANIGRRDERKSVEMFL